MSRESCDELGRYEQLVRAAMGPATDFFSEVEIGRAIQVERGITLPKTLSGSRWDELYSLFDPLTKDAGIVDSPIVDRVGHNRASYPGLLVYCWAMSFRLAGPENTVAGDLLEPVRAWCRFWGDRANASAIPVESTGIPAALGAQVSGRAWNALALFATASFLKNPRGETVADDCFSAMIAHQQDNGAFLHAERWDNPETRWYHELVLLHTAASYAAQSGDERVRAAVMRAADWHMNESQPDHASSQPWGLLAFIWNREARTLADQLLHSIQIQHPHGADGISSMLLADCLYCLPFINRP